MAKQSNGTHSIDWKEIFAVLDMTKPRHVKKLLKILFDTVDSMGEPTNSNVNLLVPTIVANESWIKGKSGSPHACRDFRRDEKWSQGWKRMMLHGHIVESLMTKERPLDEEEISIEKGGAVPKGGVKNGNLAFIVSGPPAAGKSRMSGPLAVKTNSIIIDPDDVKRMLPEYRSGLNASGLHEESSQIAKGPNGVLDCAASTGANIVYPMLGCSYQRLIEMRGWLVSLGYTVFLITIHCPIEIAAVRSLERMAKTGRYIPLNLLLVGVSNSPLVAYLRATKFPGWAGHALFDASKNGELPALVKETNFKKYFELIESHS